MILKLLIISFLNFFIFGTANSLPCIENTLSKSSVKLLANQWSCKDLTKNKKQKKENSDNTKEIPQHCCFHNFCQHYAYSTNTNLYYSHLSVTPHTLNNYPFKVYKNNILDSLFRPPRIS